MSVLIAKASGNLTASTTWGLVDSTSYLNAENATESLLTTAYSGTRSSAFTPGAITIDGIAVKLCERLGTTGTISVNLEKDSDDSQVAGTEVTINVADLPSCLETNLAGGWIFFKFASPVTLAGATAYQVAAKTSSANMVDLWCNGTADNLARALRTTTEQAPVAGDDMIICGEKTSAGAETAITVTMNETATTDYGSAPTAANSLIGPGLAICDGGTLQYGTTAATNYYFKMSNTIIVYAGGTLNIGTTGTPIPRDSTAVLEFDPAADGDYGLIIRHLGTFNSQGLSRSSGKNVIACKLNTDEAVNSTSLGVDADTGWLDNDEIVVASTTRTASQNEKGTLNGNAGASSLTVDGFAGAGGGLANAHGGTSPVQAEVILLTRNVKIRSATSTIMAYVAIAPVANDAPSVDIDWTEFYYLGESVTGYKYGVTVGNGGGAFSGSFDMQYSSLHDFENYGFRSLHTSGNNINVSNNVFYSLNTSVNASTSAIFFNATNQINTVIGNYFLSLNSPNSANYGGILLSDVGLTFQNNYIAGVIGGANTAGIILQETNAILGTFSGNTIHSCSGIGLRFNSSNTNLTGTISTMSLWRNTGVGLQGAQTRKIIFDTWTAFGNGTSNIEISSTSAGVTIIKNSDLNGDASFSTTQGINAGPNELYIVDSNLGVTTAHATQDITAGSTAGNPKIYLFNTTLASSTEFASLTSFPETGEIHSTKHDASSTTYKSLYRYGIIASDQTIRHTASGYSWKLTPNNASFKLILPGPTQFNTFKAAVNASSQVTITAYVYKDSSYNGNAPRLVIVGGIIGGVASDVTDSLTVAHSNWEQLSVQATPNEAGVIEYYIDCDGTAGNVYVDDIDVSQA